MTADTVGVDGKVYFGNLTDEEIEHAMKALGDDADKQVRGQADPRHGWFSDGFANY